MSDNPTINTVDVDKENADLKAHVDLLTEEVAKLTDAKAAAEANATALIEKNNGLKAAAAEFETKLNALQTEYDGLKTLSGEAAGDVKPLAEAIDAELARGNVPYYFSSLLTSIRQSAVELRSKITGFHQAAAGHAALPDEEPAAIADATQASLAQTHRNI